MPVFWPADAEVVPGEETRVRTMARRMYLGTLLLVSLVNLNSVVLYKNTSGPPLLAMLNYTIAFYSVMLLAYASTWFVRRYKLDRRRTVHGGSTDPLTNLANWRGLNEALQQWRKGLPGHQLEAMVYIDAQGLEQINALKGQQAGDEALRSLADLLAVKAPREWTVGRVGGDEFLTLPFGSAPEEAQNYAHEVERHLAGQGFGESAEGITSDLGARVQILTDLSIEKKLRDILASAREPREGDEQAARSPATRAGVCRLMPEVGLGAYARFVWEELSETAQNQFALWRQSPTSEGVKSRANQMREILLLRTESKAFDFLTMPPIQYGVEKAASVQFLAEELARRLSVPLRRTLTLSAASTALGYLEASVDAEIEEGCTVLLVDDLVERPRLLKSCVARLSDAGANVTVLAWASKGDAE